MDEVRLGAVVRAVRQRLDLRQSDVAHLAGVSQRTVSLVEAGRLDGLSVHTLRAVTDALRIRLVFLAQWRGGDADRLLDAAHAGLVEACTRVLGRYGWQVIPEVTFSRYGERGSIDLAAWQPAARVLMVVEVKSRILDVQATLAGLDRKTRLAPLLVRERGWRPAATARFLVAADIKANRSIVARHAALFGSALPLRSRAVRSWIRRPDGAVAGVWFLSSSAGAAGRRGPRPRQRVRPRRPRSARCAIGVARPSSAV